MNSGGRGVGGATVFIDDVQRGTTDSQGYFKLDQVYSEVTFIVWLICSFSLPRRTDIAFCIVLN